MKKNVGTIDRIIRLLIGLFIVVYIGFVQGSWWGLIGIIPLFTVVTSSCLPYTIFGINTCKLKDPEKK